VIKTFKDAETALLWKTGKSRPIPANIRRAALKKLSLIHWATTLFDLAAPLGNRLEALTRGRKRQRSIRVNDQFLICFVWRDSNAFEVEIADYH
jgi:proteic killer suppression protein